MLGPLIAYLCILFADNNYRDKLLCVTMILYLVTYSFVKWTCYLTTVDLVHLYLFSNLIVFFLLFKLSKENIYVKLYLISLVLPQTYYLAVLYKPYLLSPMIPFWFLLKVDSLFLWGVVFLLQDQKVGWNIESMTTREYVVSTGVLISFLLF